MKPPHTDQIKNATVDENPMSMFLGEILDIIILTLKGYNRISSSPEMCSPNPSFEQVQDEKVKKNTTSNRLMNVKPQTQGERR